MSDRKLQLQVLFNAVDKLSAPLKSLQAGNKKLAAATSETRKQIKQLENQAGKLGTFNKLRDAVSQNAEKLKGSARELRNVRRAFQETENPSKKLTAELNRQTRAHQTLLKAQRDELSKLSQVRNELHSNNIDTKALAHSQELLSQKTKLANDAMARQESQLKRNGEMQRQYQKAKEVRNNLAIKGAGMLAVGGGMMATMMPSINEQSKYQQQVDQFHALGVDDKTINNAKAFADNLHIMGNSITDNLETLKEAHAVLRHYDEAKMVTPELLKMKFATNFLSARGLNDESAQTLRDQAPAVLKIAELRNQINTPEQFKQSVNMSTQAFAASGGMVKPEDYLAFIKTGGEAAKNLSPEAFYFGFSHIMQQIGGDRSGSALHSLNSGWVGKHIDERAKDALVSLGLADPKSVKYSKTGHIKDFKLLDQAAFQRDPATYLMQEVVPRIKQKYPNLNDAGIRNIITSLSSNGKAQDLLALMYREHTNIEKQVTAGRQAYGVDQLVDLGKNNPAGKKLILEKQADDLKKQIGADLMPAYVGALDKLAKAIRVVNAEMKKHPRMTKYLIEGVAGVGLLTAALGGLALVLAGIIGPFATLRYMWGMFTGGRRAAKDIRLLKTALEELNGAGGKAAKKPGLIIRVIKKLIGWAGKLPKVIKAVKEVVAALARSAWVSAASKIARAARILSGVFKVVRIAVVAFGESLWTLMANPIIAVITVAIALLGLAVYEMWQHWDKVKPWLLKFWNEICGAASAAWDYLKQKWDGMAAWFEALPARFKAFGSSIINGLMDGIDEKWQELKAKISKVTDMLPDWMKPGDDANPDGVSAPNARPRPALSYSPLRTATASASGYAPPPAPIVLHVHPSAGMNEKALAQHAVNVLQKQQRRQQASARGKLADID
ncbi:hypothetical protein FOT62_13905 [Serratia marcescens]|uniref:Phage tail tape measure protein n=1 Tax=Serratia marcescens TaxID=615 RepID=A0A5C7C8J9_SERMA|nr:hypothetical protein [Serratia marcescens]TXE33260.1 hypothetical protein FOT62_13905 [Serratia marcescens]TXE65216.1 hypothetical protein FOT56_08470 [Serratia marcescens]